MNLGGAIALDKIDLVAQDVVLDGGHAQAEDLALKALASLVELGLVALELATLSRKLLQAAADVVDCARALVDDCL